MNLGNYQSTFPVAHMRTRSDAAKRRPDNGSNRTENRMSNLAAHVSRQASQARNGGRSARVTPNKSSTLWTKTNKTNAQPQGELPEQGGQAAASTDGRPTRTLKFKKTTSRRPGQQVSRKPAQTPAEQIVRETRQQVSEKLQVRADLDVGFQHFLSGNAPSVLSQGLVPDKKKSKEKYTNSHLLQRFDLEDEDGVLVPSKRGGSSSAGRLISGRFRSSTEQGFLGAGHNGRQAASLETEWNQAQQSVDEVGEVVNLTPQLNMPTPGYVPATGRAGFRRSGVVFAASFLGLAQ